jgi:hypothetical protein
MKDKRKWGGSTYQIQSFQKTETDRGLALKYLTYIP